MKIDPPGFFIKEELEARGWSQSDLAYILEMKTAQLNQILSGKTALSADMAVTLGEAFDMPAQFFADLQSQYSLSIASPADPAVRQRAVWQNAFPIREMIKRSWIDDVEPGLIDAQMMRFFEVSNMGDVPFVGNDVAPISHAAKKTSYDGVTPIQIAWLYRTRQLAKRLNVPAYSEPKLRKALTNLANMRNDPDDAPTIVKILHESGVRVVIVEALPQSKIDGVCTWIDDNPVVGLTNRYDRFDNFCFVLRHECEHVLRKHGKNTGFSAIDNDQTLKGESVNEEEEIANEAASNFCVEQKLLDSLIARKGKYVSERDILAFAKRLAIHPALAIGQYQHRTGKFHFLRKYLGQSVCGVRKSLLETFAGSCVVDGWGEYASAEL